MKLLRNTASLFGLAEHGSVALGLGLIRMSSSPKAPPSVKGQLARLPWRYILNHQKLRLGDITPFETEEIELDAS